MSVQKKAADRSNSRQQLASTAAVILPLVLIAVFCGCATENKTDQPVADKYALPLKSVDEFLYDAKGGDEVGEIKFITNDETFAVFMNIRKASATCYPFQGNFAGNYTPLSGRFFIHAGPDANNLYITIHDGNSLYDDVFRKNRPADENCYLVSIMDQKTFIRVMDRRTQPFDPAAVLDTLSPPLLSQTIMRVRYAK